MKWGDVLGGIEGTLLARRSSTSGLCTTMTLWLQVVGQSRERPGELFWAVAKMCGDVFVVLRIPFGHGFSQPTMEG